MNTQCALFASRVSIDSKIDYYKLLNIQRSASQKQIRLAYFNMAKRHHPDLNQHKSEQEYEASNKMFQSINDAYQILSDRASKQRYDDLVGNSEAKAFDIDSSGVYGDLLRKKAEKQHTREEQKPLDLDEELRKLERIKQ